MTEDMRTMSIRLPMPLYEALRAVAYEAHKPMNGIIVAALSAALSKEQESS